MRLRNSCRLTKKAEPPPTRGVNRDSGTASANGGWLRRLVRPHVSCYIYKCRRLHKTKSLKVVSANTTMENKILPLCLRARRHNEIVTIRHVPRIVIEEMLSKQPH